jgi:hypothetical protein
MQTPAWPTVVRKILKGESIGRIDMAEMMEFTLSRLLDQKKVESAMLMDIEVLGGECPVCKKPFKRVDVQNKWVSYTYYIPACSCFPQCPLCSRLMHHEVMSTSKYCTHCGPIRCFEKTETTQRDEETGRKAKKIVRCTGRLVARMKYWQCDTCNKIYNSQELYQIFHGMEESL